ncbi:MAG TPA: TetR/AcrR family transcriptional regulator [Chloroflexota bacterium]|nr:TetR/AcrR family transcriptional regulator [Chloroflexota bacterium]
MPVRREKKDNTRRQLLEAAAELFAEKGFARASLMDIAESAGLTTGAIYSNFRGKEALLVAVVDYQLRKLAGEALTPEADTPIIEQARMAARMVDKPESRRLLRLQFELYLLSLNDPAIRDEMRAGELEITETLAEQMAASGEPLDEGPIPSLQQLAEVFYATVQGLQQHRMLFPDAVPIEVFEWWARTLQRAALTAAGPRPV